MSEETTPVRRVPGWLIAAAVSPTLLVVLIEIARELGYPLSGVDVPMLVLAWAFTTIPLALLVIGLARQAPPGAHATEDVKAAMEAVSRAEHVAIRNAQSVARIEQLLAAQAPAAAPVAAASRPRLAFAAMIVLALLVTGGFAYSITRVANETDAIHVHPTFAVFVHDERLDFSLPVFDLAARGVLESHLHAPDGATMHVEGPPGQTLGQFFRDALATNLTDTRLQLDNLAHGGLILEDGKGGDLRLHVAPRGGEWREVVDIDGYEPADGDRILLSFGNLTPEKLEIQKASLPG